jgi:hypothetical protein
LRDAIDQGFLMHYVVHDVIFVTFVVIFFLALFRTGQKLLQWLENHKGRLSTKASQPQATVIKNQPR